MGTDPPNNGHVGRLIVNQGKVVRPSPRIASVGRAIPGATRQR